MLKSELLKEKIAEQQRLLQEITALKEESRKEWKENTLLTLRWDEIIILWGIVDVFEKYYNSQNDWIWVSYNKVIRKVKDLLKSLPN